MKLWRRTAAGIFAASILCGAMPANTPVRDVFSGAVTTAEAAEVTNSGYCGASTNEGGEESVTWSLDDEGTLTVSGSGAMADYEYDDAPWYDYRSSIKQIVIENGVTSIGDAAFNCCTSLSSVTIADSVTWIGCQAFEDTPWLNAKRSENPLVIVNGIVIDKAVPRLIQRKPQIGAISGLFENGRPMRSYFFALSPVR